MTPDQSAELARWILLDFLWGLSGAMAWDLIKVGMARAIAVAVGVLARHQRIAAARKRAEDAFFESQ